MSKRPSEHPPLDPGTLCMGLAAMLGEILSDLTVKVVRRKKWVLQRTRLARARGYAVC
jgi:hypothetical protein